MRLSRLLLCSGLLAPVAFAAVATTPQAAQSPAPAQAPLPQTLAPDEAAALLEQLGLPAGTKLTLPARAKLPNGPVKVAIDCDLDNDVRMHFTSWIKEWNRTRSRRLIVSPELEAAHVVLARGVRRDGVQLGDDRHLAVVPPAIPVPDRPVEPAPAVTRYRKAHDRVPVFAYVLVKVPGGYDIAWRFADLAEIDTKTDGLELWNAFRSLLLSRKAP